MADDRYRAPRIKEQYKDNAIGVMKHVEDAKDLRKKDIQHKEAELKSKQELHEGCASE